ncbi:DUF4205-containing protein [Aureococcus anophagefferens]|nr:DUF4205-containing protein [Aureococcus anophagefferens]
MAPLRLLRAVAVALAVSRAAGQDYVSQALANSFSVDGDASVRGAHHAQRRQQRAHRRVGTTTRGRRRRVLRARQLEDAANREVVGHIAAALQSDGATRRALLDWADRVDDAIAPERPGAPLFELVVAQGYGPLAVVGGDTARGAADAWCAEFAIAESECYFVAATAPAAAPPGEAADARVQQDHRDLVAEVVRDGVDGGGGGLVEAADDEDDVAPVPEAAGTTAAPPRGRGRAPKPFAGAARLFFFFFFLPRRERAAPSTGSAATVHRASALLAARLGRRAPA